jgi:hypothetical protein
VTSAAPSTIAAAPISPRLRVATPTRRMAPPNHPFPIARRSRAPALRILLARQPERDTTRRLISLWIARWDGSSSLTGWSGISNSQSAVHQRGKQYRGDHDETYGGVTLNIDNDRFDAPVATVSYAYQVMSSTSLNARTGPSTSYPVVKSYLPGATVRGVRQAPGHRATRPTASPSHGADSRHGDVRPSLR